MLGPATKSPWPRSQMRSTQASGSTSATASAPGPTTRAPRHATDRHPPRGRLLPVARAPVHTGPVSHWAVRSVPSGYRPAPWSARAHRPHLTSKRRSNSWPPAPACSSAAGSSACSAAVTPASSVDAVAAYRNPDGGFGHALEPDGRCPGSQALAIDFALRVLLEAARGTPPWPTVPAAGSPRTPRPGAAWCSWDRSVEDWPHAPWWVPEEGGPASPICTGLLAGTLHAAAAVKGDGEVGGGPAHPWLSQATELLWSRIDALADVGPYDMRALFWFLDHVPDRDRACAAMEKIGPMIFDGGMVALDRRPGRGALPAGLRAAARLAGPQPVRPADDQRRPGPPGRGATAPTAAGRSTGWPGRRRRSGSGAAA